MNRIIAMMLSMFRTCKLVLVNNTLVWSSNASAQACYDDFDLALGNLENLVQLQTQPIKSFTQEKEEKKGTMATLANTMRSKVQAWAAATGNTALYGQMNISESMIVKAEGNTAKAMAQSIYDDANAMPAIDKTTFEISAGDLTSLSGAISAYNDILNVPRQKITQRKGYTKMLNIHTKIADKILKTRMDKIIEGYKANAFEFWLAYTDARAEVGPNYRIARIAGETVNAVTKEKLYGVTVKAESKGPKKKVFEDMTDTDGQFVMREISPEVYDITFDVPGFAPVTKMNIAMTGGEHLNLGNIELSPLN